MQVILTKMDLAKYPFTKEAAQYVRGLRVATEDLGRASLSPVMDRAESRIEEAITAAKLSTEWQDDDVEILSYPAALMLISLAGDERARRRYALAEAKRAYEMLRNESVEKLLQIAVTTFGWNARAENLQIGEGFYELAVHFTDYLRNSTRIHEPSWKLTNRNLASGYVYVTKAEFARLLKEEIERRILEKTSESSLAVPRDLAPRVNRIRTIIISKSQALGMEEIPRAVIATAMPPCVRNLLASLAEGRHIPHMGRFALTSFLTNVGVTEQEIVKVLQALTDFDERVTRYQVEHIAGKRGARRRYTPPSCKTMQTHGLCINPDDVCATIRHPLSYYRRKMRFLLGRRRPRASVATANQK